MLKKYSQYYSKVLILSDALAVAIAWVLAYFLRFSTGFIAAPKGIPRFDLYSPLVLIVILVWTSAFGIIGMYRIEGIMRRTHEFYKSFYAHFVALLVFISLTYMFSEYRYSRLVMGYYSVLSLVFLVSFRMIIRNALRSFKRKGSGSINAFIIGTGETAGELVWLFYKYAELGIKVRGIIRAHDGDKTDKIRDISVLGGLKELPVLMKEHDIKKVIIALPKEDASLADSLVKTFDDDVADLILVPAIKEYISLGCEMELFGDVPLIIINDSPIGGVNRVFKRIEDMILSAFAIIVFSPFMLTIAILVKTTSRGPVFYKQERMGLDGKTFNMLKFRSMRIDAEQQTGAVWARKDDDRKTRLGGFLRATSLDELPQFFNVLLGQMSLVGPRPERPVFVDKFRKEIPKYMLRHKVKAGITGWAQVNGWRGNTSLEKRIEFDLYYIRNWSLLFDLKIMFLTVFRGFVNKNAY